MHIFFYVQMFINVRRYVGKKSGGTLDDIHTKLIFTYRTMKFSVVPSRGALR